MLHADYAVATIDLIRQLWPDDVIQTSTGINPYRLLQEATTAQDRAKDLILRACPSLQP